MIRLQLKSFGLAVAFLALAVPYSSGAEWQFTVDVPGTKAQATMWIPPTCSKVRGILIGEQIILEDRVMQDVAIRAASADQCLAMVLLSRGAVGEFDYRGKREDKLLQAALDALAADSGYSEVATAPLLPIGHSGGAIVAWNIAYWQPSRVIAVVGLHSAALHAPGWDPKATVDGVPILAISGEYESWGHADVPLDQHWRWLRGTLLEFRAEYKQSLMSILVDPGGGHFSFNRPLAEYVSLFIRSAVQARVPADGGPLRNIALQSGWLTDVTPLSAGPSEHPAAPYEAYSGDRSLAFWHLNRELALANEHYRLGDRGKQDQRVTCGQDGELSPAAWIEDLKFEPQADGMTLRVQTGFLERTPAGVAGSGVPLKHADAKPKLSLIGGWQGGGEQTAPDTFRIRAGHLGLSDSLMMLAYQPADAHFAYAEQACQVKFPMLNKEGQPQTIRFIAIPNRVAEQGAVTLDATATSGLPVEFYVKRGPAEVDGSILRITALPPRTRLPARVTVVAYQRGRSTGEKIQSAPVVEQTFLLTAK